MSSRDGGLPLRRAMSMVIGSINAATPMLFMNAESTPAVTMIVRTMRASPCPAKRMTWRPITPATPVDVRPALRMNMAQTVMTAGLLNPDSASVVLTRPVTAIAPSTSSATRSMRSFPVTNSTMETARIPSTMAISSVTCCTPSGYSRMLPRN